MAVKKHSAIIEIGGAVASSFKSVTQTVKGDFSEVGDSIRDLKKQQDMLEKFNPDQVRQAGREYRTLKREADKLERAFKRVAKPTREMERDMLKSRRAADKAGSSFKHQKTKLDALGNELLDAGVDTHKLASEQKRLAKSLDKAKAKMEAMQKASSAMQNVGDTFAHTGQQAGRMAVGVGASVAAFTAGVTVVNTQTAEQVRLAKALGVSGEAFSAWGGLAKEAGFEADAVGDLMEEMSNKLGESKGLGEITPVTESLQMLGLAFEDLEGLSPEQQFKTIASAIKNLDDAQAAQSAADILMGGEANKFFGFLRTRKEGVNELLDQQKKLNMMTDEGREGALQYSQSVGRLGGVVSSAAGEFSGLIGGVLAPYVEDLAPKIGAMFDEHRDDIKVFGEGLGEALPKIGEFAFAMLNVLTTVGSTIGWVCDAVGGFGNMAGIVGAIIGAKFAYSGFMMAKSMWDVGNAVAPLVSARFPALISGIKAVGMAVMSNPIGLVIGAAVLAVGRLIYAWDDLKKSFLEGGIGSAIGTFFGFGDDEEDAEDKKDRKAPTPPKRQPPVVVGDTYAQARRQTFVDQAPVSREEQDVQPLPDRLSPVVGRTVPQREASQSLPMASNTMGQAAQTTESQPVIKPVVHVAPVIPAQAQRRSVQQPAPMPLPPMMRQYQAPVETKQITDNRKITIYVQATEGQSPQEIAQAVHHEFATDSAALYDPI